MTALVVAAKAVGYLFVGAGLIAFALGWAAWHWLTGAQWSRRPRRRYVARSVRAVGNMIVTVAMLGFAVAPVVTGWVSASLTLSLIVAAGAYRLRRHLDRRVVVKVGEPIRRRPDPVDVEVVELPPALRRMETTRRLLHELEAAR